MATLKRELREILERYEIDPRDKSQLWDCHGTLVLYHRAYEIIAAKEGIAFDAPVMIEANSADRIVAMLVVGHWGERTEWSVGEAAPGNSKNAYPYAIAEKRAKDRVVAKLVGLAAHVYSEDEAEEFKAGDKTQAEVSDGKEVMPDQKVPTQEDRDNAQPPSHVTAGASVPDNSDRAIAAAAYKRIKSALRAAKTPGIVGEILDVNEHDLQFIERVGRAGYDDLLSLASARRAELAASA